MKNTDGTSLLFDLPIFSREKKSLLRILENWVKDSPGTQLVFTPNPEQIVQSRGDKKFREVLQSADLLLPDGVGLVWASRFLSIFNKALPVKKRITGVSVVRELLSLAKENDWEVMVVGGRDYSPSNYFALDGLKINWEPGYEDVKHPTEIESKQLQSRIGEVRPDIVFVAFGAPYQELWLAENKSLLEKNRVKIGMAVGGSFDYLMQKVPRAPYWFRKLGLEWLFRLLVEPWRIKRQLRLLVFIALTIKKAIEK